MSVYNAGRYLAPAVESILGQTFTDFEFLIIDDGSRDGSADVLRRYAAQDARVRLTCRENKGLTRTLNELFRQSRGRLLARMDCDDIALPGRFAAQAAFMDAHPEVVCSGGYFQLIDGAGRLLTTLRPPTEDADIQRDILRGSTAICHPCAIIRASAMEQVNGYDERFKMSQDLDLWLRLGEVGQLANVSQPILKFRLHETSVSETKRHEQRQFGRMACEAAWQRRNLPDDQRTYGAEEPWRPGKDRASRHRFALRYGWWAFNSGEWTTALHYAGKAIAAQPFRADAWKLAACAALKSPNASGDSAQALPQEANTP